MFIKAQTQTGYSRKIRVIKSRGKYSFCLHKRGKRTGNKKWWIVYCNCLYNSKYQILVTHLLKYMIEDNNRKVHGCTQSELTVEHITQLEQDAKLMQLLEQRKPLI